MKCKPDPQMRRQRRQGKTSDGAYVMLSGRRVYLGPWQSEEAQMRYDQVVQEWKANARQWIERAPDIIIAEMIEGYLNHCAAYHSKDPAHITTIQSAVRPMVDLYGALPARDFGPKRLKTVRGAIIERGIAKKRPYTRRGVNRLVGEIKRAFRWAVREELVPVTVPQALDMLDGLRKGKCDLKDRPPVQPVEKNALDAVEPHLNDSTRALMWFMYYTGARCGEVCKLRPMDIDRTGALWEVTLIRHKTASRTGPRTLYIGERAQSAIRPLLLKRKDEECLFQPRDYFEKVKARAFCHRRPDQKPNPRKTDRSIADHYTTTSFRIALMHACKAAGIPAFTPHRIRHTAATNIRREMGLEHAQAVLGHTELETTQIYAAVSEQRAREAMHAVG